MDMKKIIAGAKGSQNGVYRTASPLSMLFASATSGGKNVFYVNRRGGYRHHHDGEDDF